MVNKYIFINNNRRKKQKAENTQISFDTLVSNSSESEKKEPETARPVNLSTTSNKKGKSKNLMQFVDDYVLVDIETTGLSPVQDDIIEIGAIKVENNKMVETYNQLINIDRSLPPFITNLTGITDEMLRKGKMPEEVLQEFIEFVGENVIIGHNVNFDLGFLCDKCRKYLNYNLNNDYVDTLYLARRLVPNSVNYKLGTLANYFHISYEGAHRGLKDVEITYEVYNKLRNLH